MAGSDCARTFDNNMKSIAMLILALTFLGLASADAVEDVLIDMHQVQGKLTITMTNAGTKILGVKLDNTKVKIPPDKTVSVPFPPGNNVDATIVQYTAKKRWRMAFRGMWGRQIRKFVIHLKK